MKVAIATGKFHGFTNNDFAYLQKAHAIGEELIIIVGKSDIQKQTITHLGFLKFSNYILPEGDNELPYRNELCKLIGYQQSSPEDNIELVLVANPEEIDDSMRDFCVANGVSYIS